MKAMWGQVEQAFRDTLVHKAERKRLEDLGKLYGFTRPRSEISEKAFRSALHEVAYAKRGTKLSMYNIAEAAFSDYNITFQNGWYLTTLPNELSNPTPTEWGADADELASRFTYRYIRTEYGVHMVTRTEFGVARAGVGASCAVLHLVPDEHTYYGELDPGENLLTNFFLLPIVLRENIPGPLDDDLEDWAPGSPCIAELSVVQETLSLVPPTFLLDDGITATPAGPPAMPFGGHLLADTSVDGNPSGLGPHPFYLYDGDGFEGLKIQLQRLMVAGTFLRLVHDP